MYAVRLSLGICPKSGLTIINVHSPWKKGDRRIRHDSTSKGNTYLQR